MIRRGDIRWFRFMTPDKRRPVLVLGRDELLPSLAQVPVIPLSTQARGLRWEVSLSESDGLPAPCVLKPEWIRVVDRAQLGPWIASLSEARWTEVRAALLDVLGLYETAPSHYPHLPEAGEEGACRSKFRTARPPSGTSLEPSLKQRTTLG